MNPPSTVWGGGVHGKVCWLIAYYGISGDALDLFKSYLSNRVQRVIIGDTVSECKNLNFEDLLYVYQAHK